MGELIVVVALVTGQRLADERDQERGQACDR
jgi:hypothetical protein